MTRSRRPASQRSRRERSALGLLLLVLAASLFWARWHNHTEIDRAQRDQLAHQVAGLERLLAVQLASVRTAMQGVTERLARTDPADRPAEASRQFRTLGTALPGLGELRWLDVDGRVAASSRDDTRLRDDSARNGLRRALAAPDPAALVVTEPERTAASVHAIDLALAMREAHGGIGGVVMATLDPVYFTTVLGSAIFAADMRAGVVHANGIALAYMPRDDARDGTDLSRAGSLFGRFLAGGQPAAVLDGQVIDVPEHRIVAFHRLQPPALAMDRPLVLTVSRRWDAVFEAWQKNTVAYAALYAVCALAASVFLLAFQRRRADDEQRDTRALAALRASEHQLLTLTAAMPGPVARFDRDGHYRFTNASCERWFGEPASMSLGRRWQDVFPPTAVAALEAPMAEALAGIASTFDLALPTLAGPRDAMVSIVPDRDADGAVQGCVVVLSDVTELKLAQEGLRRSEEQLRRASRLARLGGWRFDVATGRLEVTPELAELIGSRPGQTPEQTLAAALGPAERQRWRARLRQAIQDRLPIDEELSPRSADGCTAYWRVLGEAVRDAAGTVVAVQGAAQDLTAMRQAQQQLRLLEAAVAGLNDVVMITDAEPSEEPGPRTIFVNDAFERMTGYTRATMIGRSPRLLQGPGTEGPELERLRQATRAHRPVHVEILNYRRDGSPHWVEISMVPLVDAHGHATHFVAVQRDVTERRHAAAAVEAAQRELAATLAAVPDLLFDVDQDGRIHQCHAPPSRRHPIDPAGVVGRQVVDALPADAAAVVMAAIAEARARGHSAGMQYEVVSRAGRQSFELSVSGKPAPAGEPARFIVLARDVTERRMYETQRQLLERQLREAQKMESIGTLAGGIAHDFNNILAAILGNLALAREDLADDHPAQGTLEQIAKAGVRARSLVQQILTFSRRQPNPLRPRAMRPIVEETLGLLRATLPAAVRLESRLTDEDIVVSADATQLQQVLMNLCTNAWQSFAEGRGRIEVGLEPLAPGVRIAELGASGAWAHLWVRDDGVGMDALTRERIFDPFFTTKPVGKGTGLGLSVVHGIVRSHRGSVAVETTLGQGSTFHLYFPRVGERDERDGPDPLPPMPTPVEAPPEARGEHLLYVDDDEIMVLMVKQLLQRGGYRVTACSGALQALGMVALGESDFDLVISDFNMPEMSGLELAERLGRLRPQLPIIITSGYLTDEIADKARAVGVRALLQKERTLEELAGLVHAVLEGMALG